jgi:FHS family glucose/mannose:H+ symporter-like MFS transporter
MRHDSRRSSASLIWTVTMTATGMGSTMLGPFLPHLLSYWNIHDRQGGMLVAALFLGSFSGTLALPDRLDRSLHRGAIAATLGCLSFAWTTHVSTGFCPALIALLVLGFGMGQLMSSINLLVGAAPDETRSNRLANLSAAWCIGAMLSPALSTVLVRSVSPSLRLAFFAPLFLLPLAAPRSNYSAPARLVPLMQWSAWLASDALLGTLIFLVYGGIEASISAWMPAFAARQSTGHTAAAQWTLSLFWLGLIVGRTVVGALVAPQAEGLLLRFATLASVTCLFWLIFAPTVAQILACSAVMGICMAPLFPLLLSAVLSRRYSNRTVGLMLACCALGSAIFPYLLGLLSNFSSLRVGMIIPIAGLCFLIAFRLKSPPHYAIPDLAP